MDRQEYERYGAQVPAESALAELRRWITHEGIDRRVSALMREAEIGSAAAQDDFCNRVEGLLRSIEERERLVGDRPIITVTQAPGPPSPPRTLTDLTIAEQVPPTVKAPVPTAPAPPTVPKPRPCDLKALAQYERALELHPELGVEPDEVLVVALDEEGPPRRGLPLREPDGEVACAVVISRCAIDPLRVRPDAEVPDVQHPLEPDAERGLEREDVVVEPVEGSVDVASGAQNHAGQDARDARDIQSSTAMRTSLRQRSLARTTNRYSCLSPRRVRWTL